MKTRLDSLILYFLFLVYNIYPQSGWFDLNTGVSNNLTSLYFLSENTGYSLGDVNKILKTTNSGISWDTLSVNYYYQNFSSVFFLNNLTGFIAGNRYLYKTINSGSNWTIVISLTSTPYNKIYFSSSTAGFLLSWNKIYRTTNTGLNWDASIFNSYISFYCIDFINENTGFVGGVYVESNVNSVFLKTTNAGLNWLALPEMSCIGINSIKCFDSNSVYALIYDCSNYANVDKFAKTTNGGNSWELYSLGSNYYNSIFFINTSTGYLVGDYGFILKTTNSGVNWYNQTFGQGGPVLNAIQFLNDTVGFAVGGNGKIKKTTNGGGPIGINKTSAEIPNDFKLYQNYPNPFNPITKLTFDIPIKSITKIEIYNMTGQLLSVLMNDELQPGIYEADFDGTNYPSGIYFCRLSSENYNQSIKMILVK